MVTPENTYARFHGLEKLTKSGLVAYIFLLISGGIVAGMGTDRMVRALSGMDVCALILVGVAIRDCFFLLVRGVDRIDWLGKLHIWVDRKFFGFAARSNRIIFSEFVRLLEPAERSRLERLPADRRDAIAESVLSGLAEDQSIFDSLMQRGIFRSWIWYWIAIYGVLVFGVLTLLAGARMAMLPTVYARALLTAIGTVAVLHAGVCLLLGYNVIMVTRRIAREFGRYFRTEIVDILRRQGSM